MFVCACVYLSSLESTRTNRNEELMASQSLIQIPVVCQRTSGVIILWCLILHLVSLSPPVVFLIHGEFEINIWVRGNIQSSAHIQIIIILISFKFCKKKYYEPGLVPKHYEIIQVHWHSDRWICWPLWIWVAWWHNEKLEKDRVLSIIWLPSSISPPVQLFWYLLFPKLLVFLDSCIWQTLWP